MTARRRRWIWCVALALALGWGCGALVPNGDGRAVDAGDAQADAGGG